MIRSVSPLRETRNNNKTDYHDEIHLNHSHATGTYSGGKR